MYNRKSLHLFLVGLAGITLLGASCSKVKDLYNETDTGSDSLSLFPDGVSVPTDFMWNSARAVDVRIAVDDKFSGKYFYRVDIFDNDPALGAGANLLAAGQAKSGQDFVGKLMIPTIAKYIYLRETSPLGVAAVSMIEVGQQNTINVDGTKAGSSSKASVLRAATTTNAMASSGLKAATVEATPVVVPGDAIALSGNSTISVESNKSYVVKSGVTFTGKIDANNGTSNVKIYIQGSWKNTSFELNLGSNNGLYVTQAGSIDLVNVTQNTVGGFVNYGSASLSKMETRNNTLYVNYGTLTADKADITNGNFTNYGVATIQNLSSTTGGTVIRNEGTLTVQNATLTNATLEAVCHTVINSLTTNGATISIAQGALLSLDKLDAGGTKINLASSAILDVKTLAKFNSQASTMNGPSSGQALARLKKVDVKDQNMAITYSGNLEIACSDHSANGQWNTFYVVNSPAKLVPYDKSTVVIAGTSCNAGGNNASGGNPNDQTVTEVKLGTYSYAFEDNWPSIGDYDMNDFVVDVAITKVQNSANKITKLKLVNKIRSVGAKNRLAAAIQLDGILATNVKSVKYTNTNLVGQNLPLGSNGVESNQKYAVVTLCDDAHKAFGISDTQFISTQNGSFQPVESEITIEFNTALDNFTFADLNSFIITNGYKVSSRTEIHLVGYKATDKMNKTLVENQTAKGQLSANDPFRSSKGEPWGLSIPVSFVYPNEYKKITGVYPKFQSWALSGGSQDTNWYIK
ncbi:LruC domain-containing protein [Sphingobacterium siyangense]|uniref:LruC domain-containing protein n=1 Tax=Sphingobacterium siyangense TaxID=459529 RepID=UPI0019627FE5|nr:LruC domain-containing protein [Sphingobacterium siyangense]QRY58268.1 LruC domain-containing protein [Sphingobacterium siyangense]